MTKPTMGCRLKVQFLHRRLSISGSFPSFITSEVKFPWISPENTISNPGLLAPHAAYPSSILSIWLRYPSILKICTPRVFPRISGHQRRRRQNPALMKSQSSPFQTTCWNHWYPWINIHLFILHGFWFNR